MILKRWICIDREYRVYIPFTLLFLWLFRRNAVLLCFNCFYAVGAFDSFFRDKMCLYVCSVYLIKIVFLYFIFLWCSSDKAKKNCLLKYSYKERMAYFRLGGSAECFANVCELKWYDNRIFDMGCQIHMMCAAASTMCAFIKFSFKYFFLFFYMCMFTT